MAPAAKDATPGRRKKTGQQYFDVGKVGRKTGLTLADTGVRDEHGLEPVSGIFSSPGSLDQTRYGERTLTSEGMDMEESTAPDVRSAMSDRKKTPRHPLSKISPLKHTTIGGTPKRMSSVRPQSREATSEEPEKESLRENAVNRKIDFGGVNRNRKSLHVVDAGSPFKPKHKLRRSTNPVRPDVYDYETDGTALASIEHTHTHGVGEDESVEQSIEGDYEPAPVDDYDAPPVDDEPEEVSFEEPVKRKRGRPRKSDPSNTSQIQDSPAAAGLKPSSGSKRARASLRDETEVEAGPSKKRTRTSGGSTMHADRGELDPAEIAHGDEYFDDGAEDDADQPQLDAQLEAEEHAEPKKKAKGGRPKGKKGKTAAVKEASASRPRGSPIKIRDSPSKKRGASAGPMSNVNLRAHTPFDDANHTTSRAGRNLIQPLKFWANENRIWKNGKIEGIIRAEPVEEPKKKQARRKKSRKHNSRLHDIEEESDTESCLPDEWEENMGVITGNVASWNPETKAGDPEDPYQEDLAFAASSIITRDVAGSDFKYAKIMTIPFFGAGIVELPPQGFKRAKNSRKMHMVFFVHQGKVTVEVGATGLEVNSFPLSKGGVWIVPRGNNYAISNESTTKTARIFFAQGNEVESADNALSTH